MYHDGVYYWYGENKAGSTYTAYSLGYANSSQTCAPRTFFFTCRSKCLTCYANHELQVQSVADSHLLGNVKLHVWFSAFQAFDDCQVMQV